MKIKELVNFLQGLDQEADILWPAYYFDVREGFVMDNPTLSGIVVRPADTEYNNQYVGNVYLIDSNGV